MTLEPGHNLLHYRLLEKLGEGGMGVVWKAVDTTLGRDVAVKILPEMFAQQPDRLARFEREARLLASLNHPSIASIYGLHECDTGAGSFRFLAMELVEGEDLSQRMLRGKMPIEDALAVTRQICEALEAAHGAGVVHRDLKPANVMLSSEGKAKVLDFGLAKLATEPESGSGASASRSPTVTSAGSQAGMILGTAAYMSPEQARGKPVDRRGDIWALGCLLFEMLTGQAAFRGETITDTLAAVVRADPDMEKLPPGTPMSVRRLLQRCLSKDPHQRLHDIADARIELDESNPWLGDEAKQAAEIVDKTTPRPRERVAWLLAVAGVAVSAWLYFAPSEGVHSSADPAHFSFNLRGFQYGLSGDLRRALDLYEGLAVSPDGRRLAFIATDDRGASVVWIRPFAHPEATPLEGTDGAEQLFWSPDGDRIAFRARGGLFAVPASGGPVQRIAMEMPSTILGGSWGNQGVILLAGFDGMQRVDASGGEVTRLSQRDEQNWPSFLPDGEHFLYVSAIEGGKRSGGDNFGIHVASLSEPSQSRLLLPVSSRAVYADGYILYVKDSALTAQPFDLEALALTGEAVVLADGLDYFQSHGGSTFSAAAGRLAFVTSKPPNAHRWIGRNGEDQGSLGEAASFSPVTSISPDGARAIAAVRSPRTGTHDLVLFDLVRGTWSHVTTEESWENHPVWSPDGRHIAYSSDIDGPPDIFALDLESGTKKLLLAAPGIQNAVAWSPKGGEILFVDQSDERNLWSVPASGDGDPARLAPSAPTIADEVSFSPDGRWLAFASLESGRYEIYVQPYKRTGAKIRVSRNGGQRPRWRSDGRELFFQSGQSILAVAVEPGEDFVSGNPTTLFKLDGPFAFQDAMPDGERFLVLIEPSPGDSQPIHVMLDWQEFLPNASR